MDPVFSDRKGWRETAVVVNGELKPILSAALLNELFPRHPRMSGWPVWIDSRGLGDENKPHPIEGGWEALVILDHPAFVAAPMIDFWRLEAKGKFYHRRSYEDDVWTKLDAQARGKVLDFPMTINRVAETVGTASVFARHLSAIPENATMTMAVRWSNLANRLLQSWSEPGRDLFNRYQAFQDSANSEVIIPLAPPRTALGPYVEELVRPLFEIFGAPLSSAVIREIANKALSAGPM